MTLGGPADCGQGAVFSEKYTKHIQTHSHWDVFDVKVDIDIDIKISLKRKRVQPCTLNSMGLWLTSAPKG